MQYVACGFDQSDSNIVNLMYDNFSEGGIFFFDAIDRKNINKINIRAARDGKVKTIEMVTYLLELVYDISIAPNDNISSSPGFEVIFCAVV